MIPEVLSAIGAPMAPAMGNHLWQSTLCLFIAGLLTLVLRKNHARARYGLWLAASVKFLVPFSLLIALGTHLASPRFVAPAETGYFFAVEEVSQPFTKQAGSVERRLPRELAADWHYRFLPAIPPILVAVWFGGILLVLAGWWRRWRGIAEAVHAAEPLRDGREVEALTRVSRRAGVRKRIDVLLSPMSLEPGIFGIVDPVLVWPAEISEHLQDAHLEAILAHEVEHVRRRDNLAAAIHMLVEALFWFHPLVWWLGARMVDERERACDEAVLQLGGEPQVYAESILKTCQFCLESPLTCVAGVTGSDLKQRVLRIMTQHSAGKLSFGKKLLLVAIGVAAIAGPVVFGLANAPQIRAQAAQANNAPLPSFEVASIRLENSVDHPMSAVFQPGRFTATATTMQRLIAFAYHVKPFQVSGGPSWVSSDRFHIEAKEPDALAEELSKLPTDQQRRKTGLLLQSLLADRFKLKVSHETKELPVYALVLAKSGAKLREAKPGDTYPNGLKEPGGRPVGHANVLRIEKGQLIAQGIPFENLAMLLSFQLGRTVLDQTGLKGNYDISLRWTPDDSQAAMSQGPDGGKPGPDSALPPDSSGPSIFTAIQEQLGLKLESTKGPVEIIVIDHIERPSEN